MKVVTATIVMRGNAAYSSLGSWYLCQTITSDAYRELVSAVGKHRLDNTNGMPMMIDMDEVASITCGPERDDP
jgi:hypothetical protein